MNLNKEELNLLIRIANTNESGLEIHGVDKIDLTPQEEVSLQILWEEDLICLSDYGTDHVIVTIRGEDLLEENGYVKMCLSNDIKNKYLSDTFGNTLIGQVRINSCWIKASEIGELN